MKKVIFLLGFFSMVSCEDKEVNCGSSLIFLNKTPEILEFTYNGNIPSGCGYVGPGEKCSLGVTPKVDAKYGATAKTTKKTWGGTINVPSCTDQSLSFTY